MNPGNRTLTRLTALPGIIGQEEAGILAEPGQEASAGAKSHRSVGSRGPVLGDKRGCPFTSASRWRYFYF